ILTANRDPFHVRRDGGKQGKHTFRRFDSEKLRGPIKPGQLAVGVYLTGLVNQCSSIGNTKGGISSWMVCNKLGKGRHFASQCEILRIEGLYHEGSIADKEQMAGRFVLHPRVDLQDGLAFSAVDGGRLDLRLRGIKVLSKKQEIVSVRKKVGKPETHFLMRPVRRTNHCGHSTSGRHAIQRTRRSQSEDD